MEAPRPPGVHPGSTRPRRRRLRTEISLGVLGEILAGFLVSALLAKAPTGALLGYPFAFAGFWSVALTRREFVIRAEQAEHMLAETQRAREAEMQAAALAERARIARDINRVFAKTGSRDRAQATRYAYTHGHTDPPTGRA